MITLTIETADRILVDANFGVEFFGDRLIVGVDDVDGGMFLSGSVIVGFGFASILFITFAAALSASHPAAVMS